MTLSSKELGTQTLVSYIVIIELSTYNSEQPHLSRRWLWTGPWLGSCQSWIAPWTHWLVKLPPFRNRFWWLEVRLCQRVRLWGKSWIKELIVLSIDIIFLTLEYLSCSNTVSRADMVQNLLKSMWRVVLVLGNLVLASFGLTWNGKKILRWLNEVHYCYVSSWQADTVWCFS